MIKHSNYLKTPLNGKSLFLKLQYCTSLDWFKIKKPDRRIVQAPKKID